MIKHSHLPELDAINCIMIDYQVITCIGYTAIDQFKILDMLIT